MSGNLPALLDSARRALTEAESLEDIKDIRDRAEVLRQYAAQAGAGLEAQNRCAEIKLRAERKAGDVLAETEMDKGGRPKKNQSHRATSLKDLDINKSQSARWQQAASIPEDEFEAHIAKTKEAQGELTSASVRRLAEGIIRQDGRTGIADRQVFAPLPSGRFRLIYADPPWRYEHVRTESRAIENHYPTLTWEEIRDYEDTGGRIVADIAADDCVLFLWSTAPKLWEAMEVLRGWGFEYRTNLVWVKNSIGMGYWARSQHEHLLVGRKGKPPTPEESLRPSSVVDARRLKHSEKPAVFHELIESMYPGFGVGDRVELFAREEREGWTRWGSELCPR